MVTTYGEYMKHMDASGGQIWLRIDVDSKRAIENIPKFRLMCHKHFPDIHRVWFIRAFIMPPKDMMFEEEIGLHVDEPGDIIHEYQTVSDYYGRKLYMFTRHGGRSDASPGRLWDDDKKWPEPRPCKDISFIHENYPWLDDVSKATPGYTIDCLTTAPSELKWEGLWDGKWSIGYVLFHPDYLDTPRDKYFAETMEHVRMVNKERRMGIRTIV